MSKANNLTDFLTDLANSIRFKKGYSSTTKINPQNFNSLIMSITPNLNISTTNYIYKVSSTPNFTYMFNTTDYVIISLIDFPGSVYIKLRTLDATGNPISARSFSAQEKEHYTLTFYCNSSGLYIPKDYGRILGPLDVGCQGVSLTVETIESGTTSNWQMTIIKPALS